MNPKPTQTSMFTTQDLPLFSGTAPRAQADTFDRPGDAAPLPEHQIGFYSMATPAKPEPRVFLTSFHSLRSSAGDYAQSIYEATHEEIHFVIYDNPNDPDTGYTAYILTISYQDLFALLKDRCSVERHEPHH